jgi:hypothetical protein
VPAPTSRLLYDAEDDVAREIAERLAALIRTGAGTTESGLDGLLRHLARRGVRALRLGADAAYVVALDRRPLDACRDWQVLLDGAAWLGPAAIVPLVDTRAHAIVRHGRGGIVADWDGGLHLAPSGRHEQR